MDHRKLFTLGQPTFYIANCDERLFDSLYLQLSIFYKESVVRMLRGNMCGDVPQFFDEVAAALQFPYYFNERWNGFDKCITDLSWLPGDSYLLMVRHASSLLYDDPLGFKHLVKSFSDANEYWQNPRQDAPMDLSPKPFHVLFQCYSSESPDFTNRLSVLYAQYGDMNLDFQMVF